MTSITNFHPHALFDFGMPLMTSVMTVAFPLSLLVFILQRIKNREVISGSTDESNEDLSNIMRKTRKKRGKIWTIS